MTRILSVLIIFGLMTSCSSYNFDSTDKSMISRKVSSQDFFKMTAEERLKEVLVHVKQTSMSFPKEGNPRYFLFEFFQDRAIGIIKDLRENHSDILDEKTFVPKDKQVADKVYQLIAAYDAMAKAGIRINFSAILEADPEEASDNLHSLSKVMNYYRVDLDKKFGFFLKPEEKTALLYQEQLKLMQYLVNRIDYHFEKFISIPSRVKRVERFIRKFNKLKYKSLADFKKKVRRYRKTRDFRYTKKYFTNLDLPDSGAINGYENAFEQVLSVQTSMEVIDFLTENMAN